MFKIGLKRNRIFLLAVVVLSPFMYHVIQEERRGHFTQPTFSMDPELLQRIQDLRERLRNAEFQNSARSHELISLQAQLSQLISSHSRTNQKQLNTSNNNNAMMVADSSSLNLPSIYHLMPHLMDHPDSLVPALQVSKDRVGVSLVFGIPTIRRQKSSYLLNTIASLLDGMSQEDKDDTVIVIFIGETNPSYTKEISDAVTKRFPLEIGAGLIEIVAPPSTFYPDLNNVPLTFGDSRERVKWRTKQNLDFCFLMMYCQKKARFYIQLEDDIVATPTYAHTIKTFALQQDSNRWFMLEFSSLGFIGKLFRSSDLTKLIEFFLLFYKDKPVDWLLDHILWVKVCNPEKDAAHCNREKSQLRIRFKPSLFQHVGKESSLKGKKQNLIDKDFKKAPLFQAHLNPKAQAITTLESYQKFTIDRTYMGQTFFWCYPPHMNDVIRITFDEPISIQSFRFKSGNNEHPGDILLNATVEVLTLESRKAAKRLPGLPAGASPEAKKNYTRNEYPLSAYTTVGQFNSYGLAEGTVSKNLDKVVELRIRILTHQSPNWIIISEIHILPRKSS
ncbi:alpha-1,3-mannosyl-glycoprotein 4-beta-N-acetylglucosaminyltransferase A-like [Actinia tenebrosa]|uniref:Alpha-1,3-mannosyl-glycoprotein 4-beta-N-acetylglucosaminyltransferase A-like n=1 Tax=Actinia tenebrosa TaxID=6105 RepID=A0A6P8HSY3_ACTTE|nr:alpha-1,3-mannosyl-glycoprotein 4-beta-N-acetylglucosaminyltransferase A-like [Actinia tenebrosa]XP_031555791.1 alpha-1,3-mannosyl-glycoprotein 4-beta-N-acetylglucosaminyltransferase A-like [Actinia tenebrosa]XP_031555792.1 alpha-1,3-mannosyl-glycoprotein 4-beta-N-acetylglucosaminyltransferase A-like [Actinia tenebrosa]